MRLPWPDHIAFRGAFYFAIALLLAQVMEGTSLAFAALVFCYVLITTIAFNKAGGLYTYTGTFIGFNALQTFGIAMVTKAVMLQPADSNLLAPKETAFLYLVCEIAFLLAILVTQPLRKGKPLLDGRKYEDRLFGMCIAASVIGFIFTMAEGLHERADVPVERDPIYSYIHQFGLFLPLGIVFGTAHLILATKGKKSLAWYTVLPMLYGTLFGFVHNTKGGTYAPFLAWLTVCLALRYRFSKKELFGISGIIAFGVFLVFPYIQFTRGFVREGNMIRMAQLNWEALHDFGFIGAAREWRIHNELAAENDFREQNYYFGRDMGFIDRVSLIETEDSLVYAAQRMPSRGLEPFRDEVINLTPRFILPDKDKLVSGRFTNEMGHAIGQLGEEDDNTAIAFSFFAPAFFMVGWAAPVLVFVTGGVMFGVIDRVFGNLKYSVLALLPIAVSIHGAAENNPLAALDNVTAFILQTLIPIFTVRWLSPWFHAIMVRRQLRPSDFESLRLPRVPGPQPKPTA